MSRTDSPSSIAISASKSVAPAGESPAASDGVLVFGGDLAACGDWAAGDPAGGVGFEVESAMTVALRL